MLRMFKLLLLLLFPAINYADSGNMVSAYQLSYDEQEAGTGVAKTQYIVSDRFLRINDLDDKDGYILYDDQEKVIYSVSHYDRATLVMKNLDYKKIDVATLVATQYQAVASAPEISGHAVYQYQIRARGEPGEVCAEIQLAEGLLPQVTSLLHNYKRVVAANQVTNLYRTPKEYQTHCYLADQIYDSGEYYSKGLPVLEWHSTNTKKALLNYEKVEVSQDVFSRPEGYKEFSLGDRVF